MDTENHTTCRHGIILPNWLPDHNLSAGDRVTRGLIYLSTICYLLVGVSVITNRLMTAIEVIVAQEREYVFQRPNGAKQTVRVRLWNRIVADFTIMVIAASATEILWPIVGLFDNFEMGEFFFGPLIGCAAFRYFVIPALCTYVLPSDQRRKIKHHDLFTTIVMWCIISYGVLYRILIETSPGIIELSEALLQFLLLFMFLVIVYLHDPQFKILIWLKNKICRKKHKDQQGDASVARGNRIDHSLRDVDLLPFVGYTERTAALEFRERQRYYINIISQLSSDHPNYDPDTLENMARETIINRLPKTRAFYWIRATENFTGGIKVLQDETKIQKNTLSVSEDDKKIVCIFCDKQQYVVSKKEGTVNVAVIREGSDLSMVVLVDVCTEDGTAKAGSDYAQFKETLTFEAAEHQKNVTLTLTDNRVPGPMKEFSLNLFNIRLAERDDPEQSTTVTINSQVDLASPSSVTVKIVDGNHCGIFSFKKTEYDFLETVGELSVKVCRLDGLCGRVSLPYSTSEETENIGKHYYPKEGEIIFENEDTEKSIKIKVDADCWFEEDFTFYIDLKAPQRKEYAGFGEVEDVAHAEDIKPGLGDQAKAKIKIKSTKEFQGIVDKFMATPKISFILRSTSWKEQFQNAITAKKGTYINATENRNGGNVFPSCMDYPMHFLTIFWKVICAALPPADIAGGWACLLTSLLLIGFLTCIIQDTAIGFGCSVGLQDFITTITIVAVGLCIPDVLASQLAAVSEEHADIPINNVYATIPTSLFLGGGITLTIASIYHRCQGNVLLFSSTGLVYAAKIFWRMMLAVVGFLIFQRSPCLAGGELGGKIVFRILTILFLFACWLAFVIMTSLESYGHIGG